MAVPSVFVVHPSVPAKTMQEFIALAKKEPGKYSFASPGTGSLGHANIENFMNLAGIDLLHIPYKGAGQALNDALGGQVNAMTDNLSSSLTNIKAGKLRPLAVLALKRTELLPDVPTYTELGYPQMGDGGAGSDWLAPAGTPKAIIDKLNAGPHIRPCKTLATSKSKKTLLAKAWPTRPKSSPSKSTLRLPATPQWPSAPTSKLIDARHA